LPDRQRDVSAPLPAGWWPSYVRTPDGTRLHVVSAGPIDGTPIILLHGFPEFWWGWRHQITPLAQAGFRVIVPDQRGYAASDAPTGVSAYQLGVLVADVLAVADANQAPRFHLVGHDWGGIVAWAVAAAHGGRIERLSILNAPHLDIVSSTMRRHPSQALRSSYVAFFQLTGFAEALLRARGFARLKRMMSGTALAATFTHDEITIYAEEWARPRRLSAMLNYYRALVRRTHAPLGRVERPTQILWGMRDKALGFPLAQASLAQCQRGSLVPFPAASHWLQHDAPAAVADALIAFHGEN
jgi:pimeloyl-ACP methyl ester carboxylesterase